MIKKFSCPLSPSVAWHWGLRYTSCPLDIMEQDFQECVNCQLHTEAGQKIKKKKQEKKKIKKTKKSQIVVTEKGKTYVSP
jgi:hypothetical protein